MTANPETRDSLILRLPTPSDAQAWREFIEIYEPLLFRFARRRGLQDADAREIAQNVFLSVARAVERWQPNKQQGRFRAWLFCIARNQLINFIAKHGKQRGSGDSTQLRLLRELPEPTPEIDEITRDYRKEMFRRTGARVVSGEHLDCLLEDCGTGPGGSAGRTGSTVEPNCDLHRSQSSDSQNPRDRSAVGE
jgi:RNA polymerase sigma factor (sigma-70 family)